MDAKSAEFPTEALIRWELQREQYKNKFMRILWSTIFSLTVVVAMAVLATLLFLPVIRIRGNSMTETLYDGDVIIALNGSGYDTGDVIAFHHNNQVLVKRVIATAGDWVDIDSEGNVSVNGVLLDEPYISEKALGECSIKLPYQVPEGRNFVMGDHRGTSIDSRSVDVGCISGEDAIGKIILRIWPLNKISWME